MKVLQFDKPTCRAVGHAIEQALTEVGTEFGISLKYKGSSYQTNNCTFKIEASVISGDGTVITREADDFNRYCGLYNLLPKDLGKIIKLHDGHQYQITGLLMKSSKFPIQALCLVNQKTYKLKETTVQYLLGRKVTGIAQFTPLSIIPNGRKP
jgi:hypothetical protein